MSCKMKFPDRTSGSARVPIEVHFKDKDGYAISLIGVDHVQVNAKSVGETTLLIDAAMTVTDAAGGIAQYQLTQSESENIGQLEFQFWIWHTTDEREAEPFPDGESVYMKIKGF